MKICMIGSGYVGLVSGSCFADLGNTVWCVDKDENKIDMLNNGQIPIKKNTTKKSNPKLLLELFFLIISLRLFEVSYLLF